MQIMLSGMDRMSKVVDYFRQEAIEHLIWVGVLEGARRGIQRVGQARVAGFVAPSLAPALTPLAGILLGGYAASYMIAGQKGQDDFETFLSEPLKMPARTVKSLFTLGKEIGKAIS